MKSRSGAEPVNVPGKILFLGSYTVLEPNSPALSLAVLDHRGEGVTASSRKSPSDILTAKQFGMREEIKSPKIVRENVAGSAFYVTKKYLESKGFHTTWEVTVRNSPMFGGEFKSGLGSSAASTVAVVRSLLLANGLDPSQDHETAHKLAQYSYAAYAGRAESGFDIATCTYGHSIVYKRFRPDSISLPLNLDAGEISDKLLQSIRRPWLGMSVERAHVPRAYSILFFNIEGRNTSTLSNVSAVMNWRTRHPKEYGSVISAQNEHEKLGIQAFLRGDDEELRTQTREARETQRGLQGLVASESPKFDLIEPPELTDLIQFGEALPGVVAGRCPGAGGWDGLAFVVNKDEFEDSNSERISRAAKRCGLTLAELSLRFA